MNSQPPTRASVQDRQGTLSDPWVQWFTEVWRGLTGWRQTFYQLAQWNPGAVGAGSEATTTITVKGVGVNDAVIVCPTVLTAGVDYDGCVTATNEVTLRVKNYSTGSVNPPLTALNVIIFRQ